MLNMEINCLQNNYVRLRYIQYIYIHDSNYMITFLYGVYLNLEGGKMPTVYSMNVV